MSFRVGAVQMDLGGSQSEILKRMISYLKKAKRKKIDLLCFPEHFLHSGAKKNKIFLGRIAQACAENKIGCIVVGNLKERNLVFNTAVLINDDGKIGGKYKKVHICDDYPVRAGSSFEVFENKFCKIGVAICWDVNNPEAIYSLAKQGAEVIFCPMFWEYDLWAHSKNHLYYEKKILDSLILARAYENLAYVVFCNPFVENLKTLVKFSAIAEPHKITKQIFNKEGMIYSDIDLEYIKKIRKRYKREYGKSMGEM